MFLQYLVAVLLILIIVDRWRPKRLVKLHQQVGNDFSYLPILGNALHFIGNNEDIINSIIKAFRQIYKRKYGTITVWMGFDLILAIGDPIQAVTVLKTAFDKSFFYPMAYHLMGNGIVFSPAHIWHRRRKILAPTFAPRYVSKFVGVFESNAKIIADKFESYIGTGNFSCWNNISRYGLDSVCETILGVKVNSQNQPDHPFFKAFQEYLKNAGHRVCQPLLYSDVVYKLLPVSTRQKKAKKVIYEFVDNVIYRKQKLMTATIPENSTESLRFKTFLELMIESSEVTDTGYTHKELREETLALVLAGTDTSATGLAFALLLLSQHQEVQEKVYKECTRLIYYAKKWLARYATWVEKMLTHYGLLFLFPYLRSIRLREVFGDAERPINFEDLQNLKYLEAVIKETLRLYPPIPLITRDSENDFTLPSGVTVPRKCGIAVTIMGIQRNPHYWGADAEQFKPERFLSSTTQVPGAFMAFSYGTRNCPGQLYAMLSMKTTLATILRRYRLLPATSFKYDEENPLRLSFEIMIKHVDNFQLRIEYRDKPTC